MVLARIALAALILAGCASTTPTALVPVSQPCINASDVPAPVPPAGPLPEDARQSADLLGAVVLQLRANERVLRALITACTR